MAANIPERHTFERCSPHMTIAEHSSAGKHPHGTALVCVTPEASTAHTHCQVRHNPSFVTQLIATAADLPHTRLRRRASPIDARAAYEAGETAKSACTGHTQRIA